MVAPDNDQTRHIATTTMVMEIRELKMAMLGPSGTMKSANGSVLRTRTVLRRTRCAVGARNLRVCATIGVAGKSPILAVLAKWVAGQIR